MINIKRSSTTYVPESPPANRPQRRRMRLAGMLALALALTAWLAVASLTGDGSAEAQTSSLSVADFDQSGLQVVALASFTAGGATTLYSAADSRWGATGSLLEGDVDLSADTKIVRVMVPARNGSLLRLNDDGPLVLGAWFGESGAGADLTVWLQTDAGTTSFAANDFKTVGSSYVNFNVPATGRAIVTGIGAGDRFVLALTRPTPEPVTPPATEQVEPVGSEPDATDEDTDTRDPPDTEQVEPVGGELDATDEATDTSNLRGNEQVEPLPGKISPPAIRQLDYTLNELLLGGSAAADARRSLSLTRSADVELVRVRVTTEAGAVQAVVKFVRKNGGAVLEPRAGDTTFAADVPLSVLLALAAQPGVVGVAAIPESVPANAGATVQGATRWQGAGFGGSGVGIAIVDLGFSNYSANIGSSLPRPQAVRCYAGSISTVLSACENGGDHGTVVTEFLYDVAPDATYFLVKGDSPQAIDALDWLVANGVDVVSVSISSLSFEGPGDGTNRREPIGWLDFIHRANSRGIVVAVSAGNSGPHGFFSDSGFGDPDGDNVLDWADGDECHSVTLRGGTEYNISLRWEDSWPHATRDLDLYLKQGNSTFAKSEDVQGGGGAEYPREKMKYRVTGNTTTTFCLVVQRSAGAAPGWYQVVIAGNGSSVQMEYTSNGYSLMSGAESVSSGVLVSGAASWGATGSLPGYASRGPLPSGTIKPDIVGASHVYSNVSNVVEIGTSFSAPHVAGLAALVKQRFPWYTPAEIATWLKDHALSRGDPSPNGDWGHGFAQVPGTPATGGRVQVTGEVEVGLALTASLSGVNDPDGSSGPRQYQWYRVNNGARRLITGATSATYTPVGADQGKRLQVAVQYTDGASVREAFLSGPTGVVVEGRLTFADSTSQATASTRVNLTAGHRVAQRFDTGSEGFFNLIEVQLQTAVALPAGSRYTVKLHEKDSTSDVPGTEVVALNGSLAGSGTRSFTPAKAIELNANTTYFVVIHVVSVPSGTTNHGRMAYKTGSSNLTLATGWAIPSSSLQRSRNSTSWSQVSARMGLAVKGYLIDADNTVNWKETTFEVTEGERVFMSVQLARGATEALTIPFAILPASTAGSADYTITDPRFLPEGRAKTVLFTATDDELDEENEVLLLTFGSLPTGWVAGVRQTATLTIIDNDYPPLTVMFGNAAYTAAEGGEVAVTVTLSADPGRTVVIPIEAASEGGTSAADYSGVPSSVTFASGETSQTITFMATEDSVDDDDEGVQLSFGASLPSGVTAVTPTTTTVSITDDDDPPVTVMFGAPSYTVAEGGTETVTVTLSADPERTVVIPIVATVEGGASTADYSGVPLNVTFDSGETSQTFSFTATQDTENDDGEGVRLSIGATLPDGVSAGSTNATALTIFDDDGTGVTLSTVSLTITEGSSQTYTAVLDTQPTAAVTVTINDPAGSSGVTADPASLMFGTTDWSSPQTVTVRAAQDADDADETATVTHTVSSADSDYNAAWVSGVSVSVIDDEDPFVTVMFGASSYTAAEGGQVEITVTLSADPERTVVIPIVKTEAGGASAADYSGVPSSVTFQSGEVSQTITFMATQDTQDDDDETVALSFGGSLPTGVTAGTLSEATVSITDDDDPAVTVMFGASAYTVAEGGEVAVTVTLSADPERTLVIPIEAMLQGGATRGDYLGVPLNVTFASGETSQTITFMATQDTEDDSDESVLLRIVGTGARVTIGTPNETTVSITDDDGLPVLVSNLNQARFREVARLAQWDLAQGFMTGADAASLISIDLRLKTGNQSTPPVVKLFRDSPDGTQIATLDGPLQLDPNTERNYRFAPFEPVALNPSTEYWVVVERSSGGSPHDAPEWVGTASESEDGTPAAGWSVGNDAKRRSADSTGAFENFESKRVLFIRAKGNLHPAVVGNLNQAPLQEGSGLAQWDLAQGFMAGAGTANLASIDLRLKTGAVTTPPLVKLFRDSPDGTEVAMLSGPIELDPNTERNYSYAPHGAIALSASTEYWVVVERHPADFGQDAAEWVGTASESEDGTPAAGWSVGNDAKRRQAASTGAFDTFQSKRVLLLRVNVTPPPRVTVMFGSAAYTAAEGGQVEVTVTLSADPERTVVIPIEEMLEDGATSGDYSVVPSNVTFASGETSQTITFTATQDTEDDDGEGVQLSFGAPLPAGVTAGTPNETTVSITDDDVPAVTVSFGAASYTVAEGSSVDVEVKLDADPERTVVIPITATPGDGAEAADFSRVPDNVTFAAGETSQIITFAATDDTADDDGETVALGFGTPPSGVTAGTTSTTTVSITDNDDPAVTVSFGAASYTVTEGSSVDVEVKLDADPERTVVIPITATPGDGAEAADFSRVPDNVTFAAGETSQIITFAATDDTADDDGETVALGFGTPPSGVTAGTTSTTTVSITDNDDPAVTVSFGAASYTVTEGSSVDVEVKLDADPERTVVIPITATPGDGAEAADFSRVPDNVTFAAGETSQIITFAATDDTADDDGETVALGFGTPPSGVTAGTTSTTTVTITDNDDPAVTVSFGAASYTVTEGSTVSVEVKLDQDPERTVVIPITATPGDGATTADYSGVPVNVTFNSGDTSKEITFSAAEDTVDDDGETVALGFGTPPSGVTAGTTSTTTVSITDNDEPPAPQLTQVTVSFGAASYTVTEGSSVDVEVKLDADPERTVVIPITATPGDGAEAADFSGVPAT